MIVGIHPDQTGEESYSKKFIDYFKQRKVGIKELNLLSKNAIEQARACDGIMWRWLHNPDHKQSAQKIIHAIENILEIPVFPNDATAWHYDNKLAQHYLLTAMQVPYIKTHLFWTQQSAEEWVEQATFPLVFKLSSGASSANVLKVDCREEAKKLIYGMFNEGVFPYTHNEYARGTYEFKNLRIAKQRLKDALNLIRKNKLPPLNKTWWQPEFGYVYFQEFLPNNEYDTRVTIVGSRAFAFRRFNRPNDFRASGSGDIDVSPKKIDLRCIEIAFNVSRRAKFQSMAYDFLYDSQREPSIVEVSYTFADWAVHLCPGHWDENLNWVEGNMWPEYAIAEDFLREIEQKSK